MAGASDMVAVGVAVVGASGGAGLVIARALVIAAHAVRAVCGL